MKKISIGLGLFAAFLASCSSTQIESVVAPTADLHPGQGLFGRAVPLWVFHILEQDFRRIASRMVDDQSLLEK